MDDITKKRLESERSRMRTVPQQAVAVMDMHSLDPSNFAAHNEELYKLGLPRDVSLGIAPMMIGLPVGMMMNHTTVDGVLSLYDAVITPDVDICAEIYDHTCEREDADGRNLGDDIEDVFDSFEYAAQKVGICFHVTLADVFLWSRLFRNGIAEMIIAIEEQAQPSMELEQVRAVAVRVGRFMVETLATALQDERERPRVS